MSYAMDFSVRTDPSTLESTGFVELVPGRHNGQHWRVGSLFVWEDAFGMAEGIIARHFPLYDHLGINEIPKEVGRRIVEEWRSATIALRDLRPRDAAEVLGTSGVYGGADMLDTLSKQRDEIAEMLTTVALWVEETYERNDYVAVLGV